MAHVLFRCPNTGANVQHLLDGGPSGAERSPHEYESVTCLACTRLHFVNRLTGKLLGEKQRTWISGCWLSRRWLFGPVMLFFGWALHLRLW